MARARASETGSRDDRIRLLKHLIRTENVSRQKTLVQYLESEGFQVTQSSVSRDLREIGIVKVRGRYRLDADRDNTPSPDGALEAVSSVITALTCAGPNLLVIHTSIGMASRLALLIDQRQLPEVLGTIAGDDTLFVATPDKPSQTRLMKRFNRMRREGERDE